MNTRKGFALLGVLLLLSLMSGALALTITQVSQSLTVGQAARSSEIVKLGVEHGLSSAMTRIQNEDVTALSTPDDWNIFDGARPTTSGDFIGVLAYPPNGPSAGQLRVRVGLAGGQRARAPAGEDVRTGYGQVIEVQISVESRGDSALPAEERVSIGLLVPRRGTN